jgi:uncharacterized protein YndB with AHSA1/START domain
VAVDQPEVATVVEREVRIAARPETVFEFFTDPEKMVLWKGREADLDPQPGGVYRVEMADKIVARGEYVEVDSPSRVVFTWGWEGQESGPHSVPPGSSRVEVTFEPDGEGTLVRLRHFDLPEEARQIHGEGWDLYLGRLAVAATDGDPGPDPAGVQQPEKEE